MTNLLLSSPSPTSAALPSPCNECPLGSAPDMDGDCADLSFASSKAGDFTDVEAILYALLDSEIKTVFNKNVLYTVHMKTVFYNYYYPKACFSSKIFQKKLVSLCNLVVV